MEISQNTIVGRKVMNIMSYIKHIKDKVESINSAVENPIYSQQDNYNPFYRNSNKTYVWVDKDEEESN